MLCPKQAYCMNRTLSAPLKWQKYLLLVVFDLLDYRELTREVRRYSIDDVASISDELRRRLERSAKSESQLIVVKLVSPEAVGALPNLRISDLGDLRHLPGFVRRKVRDVTEIWFCETQFRHSLMNVAGRIRFQLGDEVPHQIVEQIWNYSPRILEYFGQPIPSDFPCSYARATRRDWGWSYTVDAIAPVGDTSAARLRSDLTCVLRTVERRRERISRFLSYLSDLGATAVSLEYKNGRRSLLVHRLGYGH